MFKIERYPLSSHELGKWVKFIWHFQADNINVHHKLLPMDSIDIILNLADEMVYETTTDRIVASNIHINGLRSGHSFICQNGNANVWGISFHAFGLYPFINKSLKEIQNNIVDLNSLSPILMEKLKESVTNETSPYKIQHIIEALNSELKINKECLKQLELINEFMNAKDEAISAFCLKRGINQRTFERLTLNMTGYTPINLRRIRRNKVASNQLLFNKTTKIPEIVYDNNYTDQAYFTKECRKFSGLSPKKFQQEKTTVLENTKIVDLVQ